ncbi:STAS domain-containing protein [Bacillus sp. FJAT-27251]|uniref:STAS domain-containing protein n=1 Tax=Bacillus sp. FJAT-27251 TaxID=1684142 RepID=UPI0006A77921|nr:STAS domain-containing protein [Bacillus sp. FJAT-27251]
MTKISLVADHFIKNADQLAVEIVEDVIRQMDLKIPEWEKQQAIQMYIEFMGFLGKDLMNKLGGVPEELLSWSKDNGERGASAGGRISEIVVRYPPTRNSFSNIVTSLSRVYELSVEESVFLLSRINCLLDLSLNETLFAFERLSDEIEKETQKEMAELSAPVVPIKEGVAVLPLIGSMDSYRAHHILENVIPRIAEKKVNYLIADFSGLYNIDLDIALHLFQIENVLRLLGITTIITGLRPKLAQTAVLGGIDLTSIKTFATVKQAVENIG